MHNLIRISIRCANIRENTIASLQKAAEHGADFVEFDVQLSKDFVPVVFHDFYVNIGLQQKAKKGGETTTLKIPVKDLTLKQLHELKVNREIHGLVAKIAKLEPLCNIKFIEFARNCYY